jgi:Undecaprenyl-phosphate glucose phosphotransferase
MADFVLIQIVFVFSWWLKFKSGYMEFDNPLPFETYFIWNIFYSVLAIGFSFVLQFYTPKRKKHFTFEFIKIVQIHFLSVLFLVSSLFLFKEIDISRSFLIMFLINIVAAMNVYRYALKLSLKQIRKSGFNKQYVLVLGAGSLGQKFHDNLKMHPEFGFEIIGFLDDQISMLLEEKKCSKAIIGDIDDLGHILESNIVDEVVIALPISEHAKFDRIVYECEKAGVKTHIIPDFYNILPSRPHFETFADMLMINVRDVPLDDFRNSLFKRTFDILFSLSVILITLPVLLLVAIGVAITSPGPVLFKQERVGLNRRTFMMYKFRSMKLEETDGSDEQWTVENDPRRTAFGVFLRKTSLDELPQFINVLKGDMSVVGPRPERPFFVEQFKEEIPKYMVKHHVRPGITGYAQSVGLRGDTSIEDRIKHDIYYIENWTFLFDLKIILKTIVNGFVNKNAY